MIPGIHDLGLFVVSGLLLNVTPGADTLCIVGRSTLQGRRAGAVAALGIGAGCLVHTFAAAVGLSAILATSAAAFTVVKWVGAAYLVWLGVGLLRGGDGRSRDPDAARLRDAGLAKVFLQGLLTNVLNPKVALFFLAFLPQFIDAQAPDKALAFVALGLIFNVNGTLWNLFVAAMAASAGSRVGGRAAAWLRRIAGGLFVGLGIRLALAERG